MKLMNIITRPPWRTLFIIIVLVSLFGLGYHLWHPGRIVRDGSHDLKTNGIWLQHGWLGDDRWFQQNEKRPDYFRNPHNILQLRKLLAEHNIVDLFPHLCPCQPSGEIATVDPQQTRQFLLIMDNRRIMPWVGGVLDLHAFPNSPLWRKRFIASIIDLLTAYPAQEYTPGCQVMITCLGITEESQPTVSRNWNPASGST